MRGKAMSGAPIISGTIQLPNPPMVEGMTMKNTMIRPCAVTKTLKTSGLPKICMPRFHQFGAHGHREQAANDTTYQGEDEIHRADVFVVGGIEPAPPSVRMIVMGDFGMGGLCCHLCLPRLLVRHFWSQVTA